MVVRSMRMAVACATVVAAACAQAAANATPQPLVRPVAQPARPSPVRARPKPGLDLSGRTRVGKASFYGGKFSGRKMADGTRMNPHDDGAASKTLPLGTTAKVINVETGESAVVTIRDRGPYVRGRIVDLSPATAQKVGIDRHDGVSQVAVTPLSLPSTAPPRSGAASRPR